ncbi:Putative E3 ubiquitin-protein ligase SINA-like 6 [Striga hermonthica]|uniref:RING-type E3 ubiquitin transferase n=1 Tax=Striga hermonthica TaxID=68872 RepID=A0A9N7N0F4_STRHE|nr:Putative E3 ubiquitin-protein ligase SINA-like 6 [Striga hermonthica]
MPVMEIEHTGWPRYPCKTVATKAKKKIQPRFKSSSSERPIDTSATTSNAAAAAAAELKSPTTVSISSSSESDSGMKSSSSPSDGGSGPTGHGNESGGKGSSRREHLAANLTDRDVLDCPICCQPLCSPVYQTLPRQDLFARSSPHGFFPGVTACPALQLHLLLGLEKVLESLIFPCKNSSSGCTESLSHTERLSHEETCEFTPFPCPFPGCKFSDKYKHVYKHFTLEHSCLSQTFSFGTSISFVGNYEDKFFLQEKIRKTLFVCTRAVSSHGVEVDVFCVGPASIEGAPFSCDLTARVGVGTSLNMKTSVECKQERTDEDRSGKYLFVPRDLMKGVVPLELELVLNESTA